MMSASVISLGRAREPVAALGAALAAHEPALAQVAEDVLEELRRDLLRVRDRVRLRQLVLAGDGQLDRGAHGVVDLRGDAHGAES